MTKILICTVGGSHQPIVSAINDLNPDFVAFVCTDRDPATGKAGSRTEIEGVGNFIKAQRDDAKPTLPNIPIQAGLTAEQFQLAITPTDDLDAIYLVCQQLINDLRQRFPTALLVADYTGGTKSMSAGLVMAAVEYPQIHLQIVTGSRSDLVKVQDGSQYAVNANSEFIRYQRLSEPYRKAWQRYAYNEAEAGLKTLDAPRNHELRGQYTRLRDLSRAFAEWDNFNHQAAYSILQNYTTHRELQPYIENLKVLTDSSPSKRDAARLYDLYLNAQRRAVQGRYDDAIARCYRLIEWTAQWLLEQRCGILTADVKPEQLPEHMPRQPNRNGCIQLGLFDAWQLLKAQLTSPAQQFIQTEEANLLNYLKIRNLSILAHGFEPVAEKDWQSFSTWLLQSFIPMLKQEIAQNGIKKPLTQLPQNYFL